MGTYQGRHALIFAAAPETDYGYIRAFLREHPDALVACADGGLRHARRIGGACVPDPPLRLAPRLACPVNFL